MKIYIISDTHFSHKNIIEFCNRPVNHAEIIFKNLMNLTSQHCLIHLGDLSLGKEQEVHDNYIKKLKCRKILVLGNHDSKSWSWYMSHGWDFVCESIRINYGGHIIMFSHKPQIWDGVWDINIHGHLHNLDRRKEHEIKKWHVLYAPELMEYKPIEVIELIKLNNVESKQ